MRDMRDKIRVEVNWERADREQWPHYQRLVCSRDELRSLYTPWHRDPETGVIAPVLPSDAHPVRVGQVADDLNCLPEKMRDGIARHLAEIQEAPHPVRLSIPIYILHSPDALILDGNHRAIALAHSDVPFEITLIAIHGPLDVDALPDFKHWKI